LHKLFFKDEILKINFFSYRLNKNLQFNLNRDDITYLISVMGQSISYYQNNTVLDIDSLEMIEDYKKGINKANYYTIVDKSTTSQVGKLLKDYKDTKDDNYRLQALSLMRKDMFDDIQKEVAISKMETYKDYFEYCYGVWKDEFNVAVAKCAINHCAFNNSRVIDWLQEQVYCLDFLDKIYLYSPYFEESENIPLRDFAIGVYDDMRKQKENVPQFVMNALYASEKHNLYNEMLIT